MSHKLLINGNGEKWGFFILTGSNEVKVIKMRFISSS